MTSLFNWERESFFKLGFAVGEESEIRLVCYIRRRSNERLGFLVAEEMLVVVACNAGCFVLSYAVDWSCFFCFFWQLIIKNLFFQRSKWLVHRFSLKCHNQNEIGPIWTKWLLDNKRTGLVLSACSFVLLTLQFITSCTEGKEGAR